MHFLIYYCLSSPTGRASILKTYAWVQPTTEKRENCNPRLANGLKLKLENHILISTSLVTIAKRLNKTQKCLIFWCHWYFLTPFGQGIILQETMVSNCFPLLKINMQSISNSIFNFVKWISFMCEPLSHCVKSFLA